MAYESKNFDHLLGIAGLSDSLLKNHFTLYQGYVANFNKLNQILIGLEKEGKYGTPEYAELNRRFGWEWNGMRLHEYYFENLTKQPKALDPVRSQSPEATADALTHRTSNGVDQNSELFKKIVVEFGSYELWEKDFKSMGTMRGIGWVILYYDASADLLFNVWINEHDVGHFAGAAPLLVMDVFEHAYMPDYGLKKGDYVEVFVKAIDWEAVVKRLKI